MRIKEIPKTASFAWSDSSQEHILLATGTSSQQYDATFSTNSSIDIFHFDAASKDMQMPHVATIVSPLRFNRLKWTVPFSNTIPNGLLIGAMDNGIINIYNPAPALRRLPDNPLVCHTQKHSGPVRTIDMNPFQHNLLASGASEAEIFIWDLNKPTEHLTPGAKVHPHDDISSLAWNRQVQYILASVSSAGRFAVWDLRNSHPVFQFSDGKIRPRACAWHPEEAVQLAIASEDDRFPAIQIWDLRSAYAPVKELMQHTRGILALDWCASDSSMLLSAGKDNRTICWDPKTDNAADQIVLELPPAGNWVFEVQWCPKNPGAIATASFDGKVAVSTLTPPANASSGTHGAAHVPKWLKRRSGASFAFGGKLVNFFQSKKNVRISQLITEPAVITAAETLKTVLEGDSEVVDDYCTKKVSSSGNLDRVLWQFLQAAFSVEPRLKYIALLGYDPSAIKHEIHDIVQSHARHEMQGGPNTSTQEYTLQVHKSLLVGDFRSAAEISLHAHNISDALMIAIAGGPELVRHVQAQYFARTTSSAAQLLSTIVHRDFAKLVQSASLEQWREVATAILTYCTASEIKQHLSALSHRMENEMEHTLALDAILVHMMAGNFDHFTHKIFEFSKQHTSSQSLHDAIEKVMLYKKAFGDANHASSPSLQLSQECEVHILSYATILANQGRLDLALFYASKVITNDQGQSFEENPLVHQLKTALGREPLNLSSISFVVDPEPEPIQSYQQSFVSEVASAQSQYASQPPQYSNQQLQPPQNQNQYQQPQPQQHQPQQQQSSAQSYAQYGSQKSVQQLSTASANPSGQPSYGYAAPSLPSNAGAGPPPTSSYVQSAPPVITNANTGAPPASGQYLAPPVGPLAPHLQDYTAPGSPMLGASAIMRSQSTQGPPPSLAGGPPQGPAAQTASNSNANRPPVPATDAYNNQRLNAAGPPPTSSLLTPPPIATPAYAAPPPAVNAPKQGPPPTQTPPYSVNPYNAPPMVNNAMPGPPATHVPSYAPPPTSIPPMTGPPQGGYAAAPSQASSFAPPTANLGPTAAYGQAPAAYNATPVSAPAPKPEVSKRWNDPPIVSSKKSTQVAPPPSAITNPLRPGVVAAAPQGAAQANSSYGQNQNTPQQFHAPQEAQPPFQQFQQAPPMQSQPQQAYQNSQYAQQPGPQQVYPQQGAPQQYQAPPQFEAVQPPAPAPIPAHSQPLFDILNGKFQLLLQTAQPAQKKKLDEVGKKLEVLYQKLREDSLPAQTPENLFYLCQAIQSQDYTTALQIQKSLTASTNPDETGQFLIGIKTLIQLAQAARI